MDWWRPRERRLFLLLRCLFCICCMDVNLLFSFDPLPLLLWLNLNVGCSGWESADSFLSSDLKLAGARETTGSTREGTTMVQVGCSVRHRYRGPPRIAWSEAWSLCLTSGLTCVRLLSAYSLGPKNGSLGSSSFAFSELASWQFALPSAAVLN